MAVYLNPQDIALIVADIGIGAFWRRMIAYLQADFERWRVFDKSPRFARHSARGVIELMPISDEDVFAFKFVNGHPDNTAQGLQTVVAFGALADVATGYPTFLTDMTFATAFRTAATSALAATRLAPRDCRTMALIGLGAQSEFQAGAFHEILGVDCLRVYDVDADATEKFQRNMSGFDVDILRCSDAAHATKGAGIITTITADKRRATILTRDMIAPGTHINAVGGDCPGKTELSRDLLLASEIFVEYAPQTRLEGEIQQLPADHPVTELHDVLTGQRPGRIAQESITVFDSVGFAVEDFSVMRLLYDLAKETGVGGKIELTPTPTNPKDLFSALQPARKHSAAPLPKRQTVDALDGSGRTPHELSY